MGVTCITIMVSQLFIAGNLAREKMADSVKKRQKIMLKVTFRMVFTQEPVRATEAR